MHLQDKVAIVTGAGKGIGTEIALRLSQEGARVVLNYAHSASGAQSAAKKMLASGRLATTYQADVSDPAQVQAMVDHTIQAFGRVDVLVNNAAVFVATYPLKDFDKITVAEWDEVMAVNLRGTFLCCRAVVPHMRQQKFGRIINISSSVFWRGIPGFLHYATSKAGVIGLTRSLAHELGKDGITVNSVAPGYTQSEGVIHVQNEGLGQDPNEIAAAQAIARPQVPADVAGAIVFLASEDSAFITGQTIVVDGGLALN